MRVVALLLTSIAGIATADERPPVNTVGDGTLLSAEFVYPLEGRATPQCHASTIVETEHGLVVAWFGGTRERHDDVGIWVARHGNAGWSRPVEVVDGSEGEEREYPCWNPVLFQPSGGPLMLFYKVGPHPRAWWGMLMTSADDGQTWSAPRRLGRDAALGAANDQLIGPVKNKPVQLTDGTLLCASSSEHDGWRVHFEQSNDVGKTWSVVGPINDGSTFGVIQPSVLVGPDGQLRVVCRTSKNGVVATSASADGGSTWGPIEATNLPNPNSGTDAITLADGRHLIVYNHATRGPRSLGRHVLNIAISDDGVTWRPVAALESGAKSDEFSYPAVIQARDGSVHATYTWKRQTVKHVVLDAGTL